MTRIDRRSLIAIPAVLGFGQRVASAQSAVRQQGVAESLPQPAIFESQNGALNVDLVAKPAIVDMRADKPVTTYTYNGIVPGESWITQPGDTMRIRLLNNLPEAPHSAHHDDMTRPHMWTNTNLHTHGLYVSPEGNSDNVFLDIPPGESFDYEITIPDDHTGGHFWCATPTSTEGWRTRCGEA